MVGTALAAVASRASADESAATSSAATSSAATSIEKQARWVAGMEPLASFEASPEWRTYARGEDERWAAARARIGIMQAWAARELTPLLLAEHTLFYPFGGPDALHAIALFGSSAKRMVLVGLEPVGSLPDLSRPNPTPPGYFTRLSAASADLHRLTFFRTQEMANDFQRDGVIATLVAAIVRMGGSVSGVGVGVGVGAAASASGSTSTTASARIDWTNSAGKARRLDYLQADLANAGLKIHTSFVNMLHGLAPYVTFLKAAMYLPAEARFASLRQAMLDDSAVIVQDDTGIPFRHFDASKWATKLFGKYEAPQPPFEDKAQADLKAALDRRSTEAVPFGIGYRIEARRSNLLIASKGGSTSR